MNEVMSIMESVSEVIVGKKDTITKVIIALMCGGHVLIEDVPGVGKTQLVSALARSVGGVFNRIQMTPDIMPSDIVGFSMLNSHTEQFEYRNGAVMCNFLLADEINRASPKSQSSLLEVMEEFQVTVDGVTRKLPQPFMVLATQNPVETYGTYHLPEAQMDRFFMRVSMGYPTIEEELAILEHTDGNGRSNTLRNSVYPPVNLEDILSIREEVQHIRVTDKVKKYILDIVNSTRNNDCMSLGISPRGSISLYKAAKATALIDARHFVTPDDVKFCAVEILAHRLILSPKGRAKYGTAQNAVSELLKTIAVPV